MEKENFTAEEQAFIKEMEELGVEGVNSKITFVKLYHNKKFYRIYSEMKSLLDSERDYIKKRERILNKLNEANTSNKTIVQKLLQNKALLKGDKDILNAQLDEIKNFQFRIEKAKNQCDYFHYKESDQARFVSFIARTLDLARSSKEKLGSNDATKVISEESIAELKNQYAKEMQWYENVLPNTRKLVKEIQNDKSVYDEDIEELREYIDDRIGYIKKLQEAYQDLEAKSISKAKDMARSTKKRERENPQIRAINKVRKENMMKEALSEYWENVEAIEKGTQNKQ